MKKSLYLLSISLLIATVLSRFITHWIAQSPPITVLGFGLLGVPLLLVLFARLKDVLTKRVFIERRLESRLARVVQNWGICLLVVAIYLFVQFLGAAFIEPLTDLRQLLVRFNISVGQFIIFLAAGYFLYEIARVFDGESNQQ
jgi:hypothetical protein